MKIYKRIALSVFVGVVVLSVATTAFCWGEVNKAKEFMAAGMYPQAIELLSKRINDKPSDSEAHFQLGICFIHTKNYQRADERFASAVRLQPDYGYKIGGQYQKAGTEKLNKGQIQSAIHLYDKAIKYQPNLKNKIAMQCKTVGLTYLEKNMLEEAVLPLKTAAAYQPQLREEIARIFFDKATAIINSTTNPKKQLKTLDAAIDFGTTQNTHSENFEIYLITQHFFI